MWRHVLLRGASHCYVARFSALLLGASHHNATHRLFKRISLHRSTAHRIAAFLCAAQRRAV
jgi:hypothetical protein